MAYNAVPTVATGDLWTASNHNTYIRDNFASGVPDIFTAKGQLAVASAADAASALSVGNEYRILSVLASEAVGVKWSALADILQIGYAGGISDDTTNTAYEDILGASVTITLNTTSTIIALAVGTGRKQTTDTLYVTMLIDGGAGPENILKTSDSSEVISPMCLLFRRTGIAAGARTIKLQFKSALGNVVNFYNGALLVLAIPSA